MKKFIIQNLITQEYWTGTEFRGGVLYAKRYVTEKEAEENLPIGEQHKISAYLMTILPIYAL